MNATNGTEAAAEAEMTLEDMCQLKPFQVEELFEEHEHVDPNVTFEMFLGGHKNMCNQLNFDWLISIIVPIIFTIICLVGIVGNLLVLVVVLQKQQMRNTTNVLIVNLAISDLLLVVICVPPTALDYAISWPLGDLGCRLVQYFIHVSCYGSVLTLVYLSLDRYLAVVYPVRSITWRTVFNAGILISITWIVVLTACSPILFVYNVSEVEWPPGKTRFFCRFQGQDFSERWFITLFFVTSLVIPLAAIIGFYINMLLRLWKGSAATHGPGPQRDKNSSKGIENKVRVTRMICIVIVVFAVCWLPLQLVLLLKAHGKYSSDNGSVVFQIFANCLAYSNSCLNPILYAFFSTNYRAAFLNIICCGRRNRSIAVSNNGLQDQAAGHKSQIQLKKMNDSKWRQTLEATNGNLEGYELQPMIEDNANEQNGTAHGCMLTIPMLDQDRKLSARTDDTFLNTEDNKSSVFPEMAEEAEEINGQVKVKATLHYVNNH